MVARRFAVGDLVFALTDIYNEGGVPDVEGGALLARPGTRGVVVRQGAERTLEQGVIYVVRFEGSDQVLGPPVTCLDEELTDDADEFPPGHSGARAP